MPAGSEFRVVAQRSTTYRYDYHVLKVEDKYQITFGEWTPSYLQRPLQVHQEQGIKVLRDEEDIAAVDDEPLMNRVQDPDAQDLGGKLFVWM